MKVRDLVNQLQMGYLPDDEVIVAYWDKETVENYGAPKMTNDAWSEVITRYENGEWHFQSSAAADFVEIAKEVVVELDEEEAEGKNVGD
jgi:hypothetical protein